MSALPRVTFATSAGTFVVEVFADRMPRSSERFLSLVKRGFYDGTHFHRVVSDALVQGGDPLSRDMSAAGVGIGGSPDGPMADEHGAQIENAPGTLGFSTQNRKDSCDCQFYVNLARNDHLDWWRGGGHAPFARIVEGLDVLQKIAAGPSTGRVAGERPRAPIRIVSAVL